MGQPTKSKSFILTSCLVAVSFAIINCQKAPNKNGVKPTVASPAGTTTGKAEEVGKLECTPEAKAAVKAIREVLKEVSVSSSGKSEAEKNALIEKRNTFITNAEALIKELDKVAEKACLLDKNSKALPTSEEGKKNNISMSEVKTHLDAVKKFLAEDKGETSGSVAKTEEQKRLEKEEKERKDKMEAANLFLKTNFQLATDEIKDMPGDNKDSKFKKFLSNGEIKTEKALELANTNKAVICAISGEKIDKSISKTLTMTFAGDYSTVKAEDALDGFKGDAMSVNLIRVNDKSEKGMIDKSMELSKLLTLTCLNMKATAVDVNKLKAAIGYKGKHIKEITVAELEKLQKDNQAAYDREQAARNPAQPAATGGVQQPAAAGAQPAAAGGAQQVTDEKKTLIAAVTTARMELGAQKQKIEAIEKRQGTALTEVNAAKAALTAAKIDADEFTTLAKQLKDAAEAVATADDALTEAKKGSDEAAKKSAQANLDAKRKALGTLESDSLKNKKIGEAKTVKSFMEMQLRSLKAIAEKAKIDGELKIEKDKLPGFESTLAAKIKAALDKGVTNEQIAAPAAAAAAPIATGAA